MSKLRHPVIIQDVTKKEIHVTYEGRYIFMSSKHGINMHETFALDYPAQIKLVEALTTFGKMRWSNFTPCEITSDSTDFQSYKDKELIGTGYLFLKPLGRRNIGIIATRPQERHTRFYSFTKSRLETFLYTLQFLIDNQINN